MRRISVLKPFAVIGPPRSVENTCEDGACPRCRRRSARSSSPCNGCTLGVPVMREGNVVGVLTVVRNEPRAFTQKQIELVETFADQAVIAIENVRLFDEVQARTRELSESLEQQTATADVLKVISRSTFDLQTVLDALLSSAIRLCSTERGMIFRYDGNFCHAVAAYNLPHEFLELWARTPVHASRATTTGRALLERRPVQIVDVQADPEYTFDEAQKMFAFRTVRPK
jgi:two-component system, NtrC family, sensor kinase